ncbi:MAG: ABC transporter ATP-binding protein, partial [Ruminococcus sp.]|nr:ABC transporter ATP-binding protein [Ruminococcus sp.]
MKLEISSLTKKYGNITALDHFSYTFTPGVYGLLGPNGAGKSTLMNLITDNLKPTSGSISFDGQETAKMGAEFRRLIGFMPQQQGVYPSFTLERFLWYMAALKGMKKPDAKADIERLIGLVNLADARKKRLGGFSGGMKQRALIAQAMLGDPKIVILDEPTAGLDPKERIRIRNLIAEIAFEKIVIIATHVVPDIEFIAKEVLLMSKGRIIDSG